MPLRDPADEMQETNDEKSEDTNKTNDVSKDAVSMLEAGVISNENVSMMDHFDAYMPYVFFFCWFSKLFFRQNNVDV